MRVALLLAVLAAGCASGGSASETHPSPAPRASSEALYDGRPLSHWVRELNDLSEARSQGAFAAVASFRSAAIPHLAEALRAEADHVRANAAHALYEIAVRSPRVEGLVPLLLGALDDGYYGVRFWSVGALGEMRPASPEAEAALERMCKDPAVGIRDSARNKLEVLRREAKK
jgi:HEAT repeat protein